MLNSSALWGLGAGAVFLLAVWLYRTHLPKVFSELRKLSEEANSLLTAPAQKHQAASENSVRLVPETQVVFRSSNDTVSTQPPDTQDPAVTSAVSAGAAISTVRTISTGILLVFWPIVTFAIPFTAFYPPLLFVYGAYPLIWYFSGVFYKAALANGTRSLLMASAPLLFLLLIGVLVLLISGLVAALQK